MPSPQELRDQRARVWEEMKTIMDAAKRDGRDLTGEERQKYDACETDLERLGDAIELQERHEAHSKALNTTDRSALIPDEKSVEDRSKEHGENYQRAFANYMRTSSNADMELDDRRALQAGFNPETRAAGIGTGGAGGYTVPPQFRAQIIQQMQAFGGMLQVAEVIHTDTGANLQWPTNNDTANVGAILAENTQMVEQDVTLGTNNIDAYMYYSKLVRVSLQLIQDSAFDVETWLVTRLGERVGRILNTHFTTGTGTAQPDGLVTGVTSGKVGATGQTTTVTYVDLIDLIDSMDPAYQTNAQFMLSQSARKSIRKLTDSQGHPLWQPSLLAGVPDQLLGYPYVINQDLPVPAANAKSILFGDFRQAYLIRLVTDLSLIRFNERYMDFLQVAFALYQRADGTLQNGSAVRAYQNSAT